MPLVMHPAGLARAYLKAYAGIPHEVWVLAGATVVNRAGSMVLPFLSLYLTRSLNLDPEAAGSLVALYGVGAMAGSLLGGALADRLGAVRVQELSFVLTSLGFLVLMNVRGSLALGLVIVAVATVAEAFRPALMASAVVLAGQSSRVRALALIRLASNLGMAIGPALGGLLAVISYQLLFVVDGATCLAAAVLLRVTLHSRERLHVGSSGLRHTGASPWRDPVFVGLLVMVAVLAMAFFQIFSTVPLELVAAHGFSEAGVGGLIGLNALLIVLVEMPLLRLVEHLSALRVAGVGGLLVCTGLAALGLCGRGAVAIAAVVVWTVGEMLALPLTNAAVAERAPEGAGGRYMGAYTLAFSAAFVLGPAAGGAVYQHLGGGVLFTGLALVGPVLLAGFWGLASFRSPASRVPRVTP